MIKTSTRVLVFFLLILLATVSVSGQTGCNDLIWAEEFEYSGAPDPLKWSYETGGGGWGNNEVQVYTNSRTNSYVSDGTLKIRAVKSGTSWTSARLVTKGKATWKYGRFEIRAKLPSGVGTWPAIWLMPQQSLYGSWPKSGEIDIMEHVGKEQNRVYGTAHTEAYNHSIGTQKGGNILVTNASTEFHVFTAAWTEAAITWCVDGKEYYTFKNELKTTKEWPFDNAFFLILNIAMGGGWGGTVDPALTEAIMEVDYIRVFRAPIPTPVINGSRYVEPFRQVSFTTLASGRCKYHWNLPEGVTLLQGDGTSKITVTWNDQPGEVRADAYHECDTITGVPFKIGLLQAPDSEFWVIPFADSSGHVLWTAHPGTTNQISLASRNDDLVVTYNIQSTIQNPQISCIFPVITDLSQYPEMMLELMGAASQVPSNIRIDLLDVNGKNDPADFFTLNNPSADGLFHPYSNTFKMDKASGWQTGYMAHIKILFNYGISGEKGAGEFVLRDMKMHDPTYTEAPLPAKNNELFIFPNPGSGPLEIRSARPFSSVRVIDISGRMLVSSEFSSQKSHRLDLTSFQPGLYFVEVSDEKGWKENRLTIRR